MHLSILLVHVADVAPLGPLAQGRPIQGGVAKLEGAWRLVHEDRRRSNAFFDAVQPNAILALLGGALIATIVGGVPIHRPDAISVHQGYALLAIDDQLAVHGILGLQEEVVADLEELVVIEVGAEHVLDGGVAVVPDVWAPPVEKISCCFLYVLLFCFLLNELFNSYIVWLCLVCCVNCYCVYNLYIAFACFFNYEFLCFCVYLLFWCYVCYY